MKWICKMCDSLIVDFDKDKKFKLSSWRFWTGKNWGRICHSCYKELDVHNYTQKGKNVK